MIGGGSGRGSELYGDFGEFGITTDEYYPTSVLHFPHDKEANQSIAQVPEKLKTHPTQKPLKLWEYLIKTYSKEGDIVLDCFCGAGTTAIAARNLGRAFICCDSHAPYVTMANTRLANTDPYLDSTFKNGDKQLSLFRDLEDK